MMRAVLLLLALAAAAQAFPNQQGAPQNARLPPLLGAPGANAQQGPGWKQHFDGGKVEDAVQSVMTRYQQALGGLSNVAGTAAQWTNSLQAQYQSLSDQLDILTAQYEAQYCTPARFEQSVKKPAKFIGQSFALTFDSGACIFDDSKWIHDHKKELECTKPGITYVKIPGNFSSKYHSAPKFVNKECSVSKVFGETNSRVLYVFDGQQPLDVQSLAKKITQEVQQAVSALSPHKNGKAGAAGPSTWMGGFGGQPGAAGLFTEHAGGGIFGEHGARGGGGGAGLGNGFGSSFGSSFGSAGGAGLQG